jgi:hypothetical protein
MNPGPIARLVLTKSKLLITSVLVLCILVVAWLLRSYIDMYLLVPIYLRWQWLLIYIESLPVEMLTLLLVVACLIPACAVLLAMPSSSVKRHRMHLVDDPRPDQPRELTDLVRRGLVDAGARNRLALLLLSWMDHRADRVVARPGCPADPAKLIAAGYRLPGQLLAWLEPPTRQQWRTRPGKGGACWKLSWFAAMINHRLLVLFKTSIMYWQASWSRKAKMRMLAEMIDVVETLEKEAGLDEPD